MPNSPKINLLELRLSGVEEGTYHVDGLVDGKSLLGCEDDEMDIPFGLLPSIEHEGDYFMVTCSCGDAGCAGYFDPVAVRHEVRIIHWFCGSLDWEFTFRRGQYASEIRRLIDEGRAYLRRNPKVESIHQNINLFRSEDYEAGLAWYWENDQKNRAEERLRRELWEKDPEEYRRRHKEPRWRPAFTILILILFLPVIVSVTAWGALRDAIKHRTNRTPNR